MSDPKLLNFSRILDLPDELMEEISNYLSLNDLKALNLCCRQVRKFLRHSMVMSKFPIIISLKNIKNFACTSNKPRHQNIKIDKMAHMTRKIHQHEVIFEYLKFCADFMQSITLIQPIFTEEFNLFLENCPRLETIEISLAKIQHGTRPLKLPKLKSLKVKEIRNCDFWVVDILNLFI